MAEPIDAPAYLVVIVVIGMTALVVAAIVGFMKIARYFNPPKARPSRDIDLEPHEYRNRGPARWREPIFGPNAKPLVVQFAVGAAASYAAYMLTKDWLPGLIARFTCTYITGSCL